MSPALKPYRAIKDSCVPWLGEVPEHWKQLPGRACYRERQVPNTGLIETTVLSLSYGRIVVKPVNKLHGLVPASFETYQIVEPGDIIIRPTDLQNDWNSLRFGLSHNRGIITSAYLCFHTTDLWTREYGHLLLHTYDLSKVFYGLGSGLRQNLDWTDFKYLPCLVPPLPEQAAIVRFLDHADRRIRRYIRAKQELITLLEEQKQAVIHEAVTGRIDGRTGWPYPGYRDSGVEWLGEVPSHWKVRRIGGFCRVGNGSTPSRSNPEYWFKGDYPWLNSSCVNQGFIEGADQFVTGQALRECHLPRVPANSVLIGITGQGRTRGMAAMLRFGATINQHLAYVTPNAGKMSSSYLHMYLTAAYGELRALSSASGSTKEALTCEDVKRFRVALPPLDEQEVLLAAVGRRLNGVERCASGTRRQLDLVQKYRVRLIADVVTGKLDVREAAARLPDEVEELESLDEAEALIDGEEEPTDALATAP